MTPARQCVHCGVWKQPRDFPAQPRCNDGLSSWCRVCHAAATKAWRQAHPEHRECRHRGPIAFFYIDCGAQLPPESRRDRKRCDECFRQRNAGSTGVPRDSDPAGSLASNDAGDEGINSAPMAEATGAASP